MSHQTATCQFTTPISDCKTLAVGSVEGMHGYKDLCWQHLCLAVQIAFEDNIPCNFQYWGREEEPIREDKFFG